MSLKDEFDNVSAKINDELMSINNHMSERGLFYSGIAVEKKGKKIPKILESELKSIVQTYNKKQDLHKIADFIITMNDKISSTFKGHGYKQDRYEEFDRRMHNLTQRLTSNRINRNTPSWLSPLLIGLSVTVVGGIIVLHIAAWLKIGAV